MSWAIGYMRGEKAFPDVARDGKGGSSGRRTSAEVYVQLEGTRVPLILDRSVAEIFLCTVLQGLFQIAISVRHRFPLF